MTTATETVTADDWQRPHGVSWVDHLIDAIDTLPGPSWLAYTGVFLGLFAWVTTADLIDGGLAVGTVRPQDLLIAAALVYFLASISYLDNVADRAFAAFRPALDVTDRGAQSIRHDLMTMPQVPVTATWTFFAALTVVGAVADPKMAGIVGVGPVAFATHVLIQGFAFGLFGVAILRVLRHARSVDRLHRSATRIDLFDRRPAHAFARLTARGGLLLILPVLIGALIALTTATPTGVVVFGFVALGIVTAATGSFVLPLRGMHDRLVVAKEARQAVCELRIEAITDEVHTAVDEADRQDADALNKTLSSLLQERDYLARVPTWPWDASTLRAFVTALVLPILLFVLFRLLERLI